MKQLSFLFSLLFILNAATFGQNSEQAAKKPQKPFSNYRAFYYLRWYTANDYVKLLDSLNRYGKTNFYKLRMCYTKTEDYNPVNTYEKELFKQATQKINKKEYKEAISIVDKILFRDYVSLNAHLINGNLYNQLHDSVKSAYHFSIVDSLMYSIFTTGNGKTPKSAYLVISPEEELPFLSYLGLQVLSVKPEETDEHHFNIYDVIDKKTKGKYTIYINTDIQKTFVPKSGTKK